MKRISDPLTQKSVAISGALCAAAGSAHAGLVQITQTHNQVDLSGNNLNGDLTGDGIEDMTLLGTMFQDPLIAYVTAFIGGLATPARGRINYISAPPIRYGYLSAFATGRNGSSKAKHEYPGSNSFRSTVTARNYVSGTFSDARINGGAPTSFKLEFTGLASYGFGVGSASVTMDRIVFQASGQGVPGMYTFGGGPYPEFVPVPEPGGSALALLAAGAIGVTSRRRTRRHDEKRRKYRPADCD